MTPYQPNQQKAAFNPPKEEAAFIPQKVVDQAIEKSRSYKAGQSEPGRGPVVVDPKIGRFALKVMHIYYVWDSLSKLQQKELIADLKKWECKVDSVFSACGTTHSSSAQRLYSKLNKHFNDAEEQESDEWPGSP